VGFFYFEMKIFILFLYQLYILIHLLIGHPCREFLGAYFQGKVIMSVLLLKCIKRIRSGQMKNIHMYDL
jgi:hypothetical protein